MMAILFMVGRGLEDPEIVPKLMDSHNCNSGRPTYIMASESPLCLVDTEYAGVDLDWRTDSTKDVRKGIDCLTLSSD